ncbi:MAG: 50S ribosomal protein L29 [Chloroflexi bacterium]|nr:50S ribosomal protein L29 [Chloroflexota bacterium]|tara:strand:- start:1441 stop:1710 length:270 start_codon:yes stop_codon:yes gene_type:complete
MKIDEIRQLNDMDLGKELIEQHKALMNLRFSKATLQLTNTNEIGNTKKIIARINTVINERRISEELNSHTQKIDQDDSSNEGKDGISGT